MSRPKPGLSAPLRWGRRITRRMVRDPLRRLTLAAGLIAVTALTVPALSPFLITVAGVGTVGIFLVTTLWGLLHPRQLAPTVPLALAWSFRMALVVALFGAGGVPEFLRQETGVEASAAVVLYIGLLGFPVLMVLLFVAGMVAAAAGGWAGRRSDAPARSARAGLAAGWYGVLLLAGLELATGQRLPEQLGAVLYLLLYPAVLLRGAAAARRQVADEPIAVRLARWLHRRLVRLPSGNRRGRDLRGAACGTLAAFAVLFLGLGPARLLVPLRYLTLGSLLQCRNEPLLSRSTWLCPSMLPSTLWNEEAAGWRNRIVLVEMDPATRRLALTQSSESRVLAAALQRLRSCRPLRILAPLPYLEASWPPGAAADADVPQPGKELALRNRSDLPRLLESLRGRPEVLVGVPRFTTLTPEQLRAHSNSPAAPRLFRQLTSDCRTALEQLSTAAHLVDTGVDWLGTPRLPVVRVRAEAPISVPGTEAPYAREVAAMRLFAATQALGARTGASSQPPGEIAPGLAMVDYGGPTPLPPFPRIAYSSLLAGAPLYAASGTPSSHEPRRQSAEEYLAGKVVLLAPLCEERRDTPVGRLTDTEILAHGLFTLASGGTVRAVPQAIQMLGVLLLGIGVGHSCAGAMPFLAGWRAGLALMLPLILAPVCILLGAWLDPVLPAVTVGATFALVSQLSYRHEQDERQQQRTLLERVAAPQVVDELLARSGRLVLGGERRHVCILFADVRGFTQFAEGHTAEQVITVINRYTTAMTELLLQHGGILDHYTGDGLVARFELLHSPEADLCRAVRAALAMRDAAEEVARRRTQEGSVPLRIGLGVHCGEAVVGLVGSPAQFNFTAMGHTVVVAARLQGCAAGGELLISDTVYQQVSHAFACEACEPVLLKGISEPVQAHRVLFAHKTE